VGTYNGQLFSWSTQGGLEQYQTYSVASMNDLQVLADSSLLITNKTKWSGPTFQNLNWDQRINARSLSQNPEGKVAYGGMHGWGLVRIGQNEAVSEYVSYDISRVFSLDFQGNDSLWIGTEEGLFLSLDTVVQNMSGVFPETQIRITDIEPMADGSVMVGTKGRGVLWLNPQRGSLQIIEKPLINSNFVKCIAISPEGDLWVGTNRGVNRFTDFRHQVLESSLSLTQAEGLASEEILDIEFFENAVWFATSRGLCFLDETGSDPEPKIPQLHILGVEQEDSLWTINDNLQFSQEQHDLTFHFLGLFYQSPERVNYRFRLVGYDETWQTTQNREAAYTNLPPGNYIFEVQTLNQFGTKPSTLNQIV
ncbi:MAG: triple tyrosine motif-containing protein, partial [Bacteroidota bacterium]